MPSKRKLQLIDTPCGYCSALLPRIRNPAKLYCDPLCRERAKRERGVIANPDYYGHRRAANTINKRAQRLIAATGGQ
jgi:hypothetical protein